MRSCRAISLTALSAVVAVSLSACSPGIPIAVKATGDSIDIAFCDAFEATSMEMVFSDYPDQGPMNAVGTRKSSGPIASFGSGVPISRSMENWTWSSDSEKPPTVWDRIDFSFFDQGGEFVDGAYLFSDDLSPDWKWQSGFNMSGPRCDVEEGD